MSRCGRLSGFLRGIALLVTLATVAPARAADLRLGYIDSARIFTDFKDAQEAQQRFDRQVQGWRDEAAEKEKLVQQLRQEVRDQGPVLSSLKRQEKEADLQKRIGEYETFIQDIWGPNGRAAAENENATRDIVTLVRAAVEKVAASKGLEMVLDSASGFIIYADRALDITPEVLTELAARSGGSR